MRDAMIVAGAASTQMPEAGYGKNAKQRANAHAPAAPLFLVVVVVVFAALEEQRRCNCERCKWHEETPFAKHSAEYTVEPAAQRSCCAHIDAE